MRSRQDEETGMLERALRSQGFSSRAGKPRISGVATRVVIVILCVAVLLGIPYMYFVARAPTIQLDFSKGTVQVYGAFKPGGSFQLRASTGTESVDGRYSGSVSVTPLVSVEQRRRGVRWAQVNRTVGEPWGDEIRVKGRSRREEVEIELDYGIPRWRSARTEAIPLAISVTFEFPRLVEGGRGGFGRSDDGFSNSSTSLEKKLNVIVQARAASWWDRWCFWWKHRNLITALCKVASLFVWFFCLGLIGTGGDVANFMRELKKQS